MNDIALRGCRAMPIGSYLKALGVHRCVARQVDPAATLRWAGNDLPCLGTSLSEDELLAFFRDEWRPSPILSPWNSDAGFKPGESSSATKTLRQVESSASPRLEAYRRAIRVARQVLASTAADASIVKDDKARKWAIVTALRNELADEAIAWLDASVVLGTDGPAYPILLGTGGNLGRLELSPNVMARVLEVTQPSPKAAIALQALLEESLLGSPGAKLEKASAGQFHPVAAGGPRSGPVGARDPLVNPWDWLLQLEGALCWAASVARRLGAGSSTASVPFTVAASNVATPGEAEGESTKGEIWAPLWTTPLPLASVERMFAEGRLSWGDRQARTGLDAVRAVSARGVDLGLSAFVRHLTAERLGQSTLVIPVAVHAVAARPLGPLLGGPLDRWIGELRRASQRRNAAASVAAASAPVERAVFAATDAEPASLLQLLVELARAEGAVGAVQSPEIPPVPALDPAVWVPAIDDGTIEVRLAVSLATARDDRGGTVSLRSLLRPVHLDGRAVRWSGTAPTIGGLARRAIADVLADAFVLRSQRALSPEDAPNADVEPWWTDGRGAMAGDAERLAAGALDLQRFGRLLQGMLLLRPQPAAFAHHRWQPDVTRGPGRSVPWRILAPAYARAPLPAPTGPTVIRPRRDWARQIVDGRLRRPLSDMARRLHANGLTSGVADVHLGGRRSGHAAGGRRLDARQHPSWWSGTGADMPRLLAAALLVPDHPADLRVLVRRSLSDLPEGAVP